MAEIHPTAIIDGNATLADDVVIGPNTVLLGDVTIGSGTQVLGNAYLQGPLTMGSGNRVYPFASIGFAPQHRGFDHDSPGLGVLIGDNNVFREGSTVHRAYTDHGPTTIGNDNYFMSNAHVGHDSIVGNNVTMVQASLLAGHVTLGDGAMISGGGGIHQFCKVGRGAMIAGLISCTKDILPWFMVTEVNYAGSLNLIGMRRSGMERAQINDARWAFKIICQSGFSTPTILERLAERAGSPIIDEYVAAIESSERGFCAGRSRSSHGGSRKAAP